MSRNIMYTVLPSIVDKYYVIDSKMLNNKSNILYSKLSWYTFITQKYCFTVDKLYEYKNILRENTLLSKL